MTVSIKNVAKATGVSHSTVSRALSNSPLVNPETAGRIRRIAREMGYSLSAIARDLVIRRIHVAFLTTIHRSGYAIGHQAAETQLTLPAGDNGVTSVVLQRVLVRESPGRWRDFR